MPADEWLGGANKITNVLYCPFPDGTPCGFCGQERGGAIFRSVTASTRACTCASCAGRGLACGSAFSTTSYRTNKPVPDARFHHRASSPASGHEPHKGGSEDAALGRSRGGLSTKIHLLADEQGLPLGFRITAGQAGEYAPAAELLDGKRAEAVLADRGYDADSLVTQSERLGAKAVIRPNAIAKYSGPTTGNSTNSATASNAASTNSNTSAASPHATAKPSRPSAHAPPSPVHGYT